ncbi:hypothetical protein B0T11DRAFT_357268 [Plectosphaerella cucumerina]|uniref:Uncharacterized protein n=1 Tax=Plectosphaerella cucumerina TaxID=40658 RepID=A0A8K0WZX5_9PEZI|nr:hypothetical protein B0T11DRAFT_357268 [Plectosphaerella cucumerina]
MKKEARLSDVHQHPPRPRAQRQDRDRGRDHQRPSIQRTAARAAPPPLRAVRGPPRVFTLGCRGCRSSTRVRSVALLENPEWVEYYRNDSLKYCRHEEKKKKKKPKRAGAGCAFIGNLEGARPDWDALDQLCGPPGRKIRSRCLVGLGEGGWSLTSLGNESSRHEGVVRKMQALKWMKAHVGSAVL